MTVLSLTPFRFTMFRIFSCSSSKSTKFFGASACSAETEVTVRGFDTWKGENDDFAEDGDMERGEVSPRGYRRLEDVLEVETSRALETNSKELLLFRDSGRGRKKYKVPSSPPTTKLPRLLWFPSFGSAVGDTCKTAVGLASAKLAATAW